ncbi:cobalamin biosynthesis protein CobD [Ferroglobus placidus DSM 10642]|uniref:Probable cobalamin biosynthesis protein CobD n=1 Tax=Ferroglobus placidus (strain DSM 10642 / AEDII12DO) TaxID=589924 RepID=D3RYE4_FERPA|nr:adenosylcobinamide-phosphate synthase CbiB [Ferroglobus placidus]ADC65507.1 cobalamin biosynthesis protein CobD [Ferroglobus placidus DSM 10642]
MIELLLALIFEAIKSEPPEKVHPSVAFGKLMGKLYSNFPKTKFFGFVSLTIVVAFALFLSTLPGYFPPPIKELLAAYLLYSSISIRSMVEHARNCLQNGRIVREEVAKIVSRNVSNLDDSKLSSAVIESVAENFVDGVLAPLIYYALFGTSGALVYRAVNVCDAMVGYKDEKFRDFGYFSAKLDDLLNFVPSRISPLLYSPKVVGCAFKKNPKLNGHSIAAMACYLKLKLTKVGSYVVNAGREPNAKDVEKSLKVFIRLSAEAVLLSAALRLASIYTF